MLTDKAKRDFERWLFKKGNEIIKDGTIEYDLYYMCKYMIPENMVYTKVIEWFDTVGLNITLNRSQHVKWISSIEDFDLPHSEKLLFYENGYDDRQSATKAAIEQANLIYNGR